MNSEKRQEPQADSEKVQLGIRLKAAREELDLSMKDVADSLRLRITVIEDIENSKFDPDNIPTFTRGYIRAYAKLVNLEADTLLKESGILPVVQQDVKMQSFSRKTRLQKNDHRLMGLTWVILSVVVGITIIWWWQGSEVEEVPEVAQVANINTAIADSDNISAPAKSTFTRTTNSETAENNTQNLTAPTKVDNVVNSPVAQLKQETETKKVENPNVAVKVPDLAMKFIADCWVDIRDSKGRRLLTGIKSRGESIELNGKQPFKIVLGAPSAVQLKFKGKKVDLSGYPPKRVARLSLPQK